MHDESRSEGESRLEPRPAVERTLDDFPLEAEVIVFAIVRGRRALRRGCIEEHTPGGRVAVRLENSSHGILSGSPELGYREPGHCFSVRPDSPELMRLGELEALQGDSERAMAWARTGGNLTEKQQRELASSIEWYSGFEGRLVPYAENYVIPRPKRTGSQGFGGS